MLTPTVPYKHLLLKQIFLLNVRSRLSSKKIHQAMPSRTRQYLSFSGINDIARSDMPFTFIYFANPILFIFV